MRLVCVAHIRLGWLVVVVVVVTCVGARGMRGFPLMHDIAERRVRVGLHWSYLYPLVQRWPVFVDDSESSSDSSSNPWEGHLE